MNFTYAAFLAVCTVVFTSFKFTSDSRVKRQELELLK